MERHLTSRRLRSWLRSELDSRGLGSVLLVALLAGCSSSSSPGASGGSGGSSSGAAGGSTSATGGQTPVGGSTSLAGATATGGSSSPGGTTAGIGGAGGAATGGSTVTSGGGLTAGGTTARGGATSTGGVTPTGGSASGGISVAGGTTSTGGTVITGLCCSCNSAGRGCGTTSTGGTVITGGTTRTGGTTATGGNTATGGVTSTGGNSATGGSSRGGGATSTGGAATGGATSTAGTTSACGASGATYDTSAVTTVCPGAVPAGITSAFCNCVNEGPGFKTGAFSVANNVWGSGPGPECVWATTSTLWGVTANHPQTSGVKSYPNIGLSPRLLISGINTYTSSFDITVPGNVGSWEAAYDMWVKAPTGNTRIELMVWMYTYQTGPISSIVASTKPTIGDYTWTVHYGSNGSNATISLVNTNPSTGATANVTSGTIDVKGILDWLIANNTTQYGQFDNTWTLDQVQWGFEISGDGGATQEFINNCFSVSST